MPSGRDGCWILREGPIVAVVVRYWWVIALAVAAVAVIVGMIMAWRDYQSSAERTAKRQAELRRRADQRQPRAGR